MASYNPGDLQARITFTNKASCTAEEFKEAIENALAPITDDPAGALFSPPDAGETGVIIGPG